MTMTAEDRLGAAVKRLAARADADALAAAVVQSVAEEVWADEVDDPAFAAAMSMSVRDNVRAALEMLAGRLELGSARPPGALAFIDLVAEAGLPVGRVEAAYWVAMRRFWREWFALAKEAAEAGEGTLEEFVGVPVELMFEHLTGVLDLVVARHESIHAQIRHTREEKRRVLVAEVLDGSTSISIGDAERTLGYGFNAGVHLALTVERATRSELERCVGKLLPACNAQAHLVHFHGASRWLLWLRFERLPAVECLDRAAAVLAESGVVAAIGEPGSGLRGFRQSRRDALEASNLRSRFHGFAPVLWYRDVRLEALLMNDEESARRFVADELAELAGPGARMARTRETLRVWLMTGSISQTSAQLWIHENTVRLRVAQAEKKLPGDPRERRTEILSALRLRAMFDGAGNPAES